MHRWMSSLRPLPFGVASLLALFALYKMEGVSIGVPIWAGLVLLSLILPYRLPDTPALLWMLRLLAIGVVVITNLSRQIEAVNVFDTRTMTWFGELCAAELTITSWVRLPRSGDASRCLWLSGLVMFAASSTPDDTFIIAIAPAYFCALLIALRWRPIPGEERVRSRIAAPARYAVAVICVLLGGGGVSALLTAKRSAIMTWSMQFLSDRIPFESGSLSINPTLTSTFGQRGSLTRALRIDGEGDFSHLRGMAYTIYSNGTWGPRDMARPQDEALAEDLDASQTGHVARVTRLLTNHGLVFAPVNAAGLRFAPGTPVYRNLLRGGTVRIALAAPSQYDVVSADDPNLQGPLCAPPSAGEKPRLLDVPREIDPRVRALAARITRGVPDEQRRLDAIAQYLMSNHHYSLRVDIGRGDPISNFLLHRKSAHCEYFASAAVILARLAGVPSRYVVGYSGHEKEEGRDSIIVRQRDAHAWAECFVQGTGWVVLDATPGDGRPGALTERPSPFGRLMERLQDLVTSLRLGVSPVGIFKLAGGAMGLVLLVGSIRAIWSFLLRRRESDRHYAYAQSDAEIAALFEDFERICRRAGLVCPPGQTWSEYLAQVEEGAKTSAPERPVPQAAKGEQGIETSVPAPHVARTAKGEERAKSSAPARPAAPAAKGEELAGTSAPAGPIARVANGEEGAQTTSSLRPAARAAEREGRAETISSARHAARSAKAFVRLYNELRFGGRATDQDLARLNSLLVGVRVSAVRRPGVGG